MHNCNTTNNSALDTSTLLKNNTGELRETWIFCGFRFCGMWRPFLYVCLWSGSIFCHFPSFSSKVSLCTWNWVLGRHFYSHSINISIDIFIDISIGISIDILIGICVEILIWQGVGKRSEGRSEGVDLFWKSNKPTPTGGEQHLQISSKDLPQTLPKIPSECLSA